MHRSSTSCIDVKNIAEPVESEDALVEDVPLFLDEMNASADDLNRTQEALKEQEQRREELINGSSDIMAAPGNAQKSPEMLENI